MFDLALDKVTATLEQLTTRTEKMGPDDVPAATLKITCPMSADILAFFAPTLRNFLFTTEKDLAGEVERVRDDHIEYPMCRDEEMVGATVSVEYGVGDPMRFEDVVVNEFRMTPMDGGTVVLGFKVNCRPSEQQIGKLYILQKKGVTLTLEPPELSEMKAA
jgi:hypothetical protein